MVSLIKLFGRDGDIRSVVCGSSISIDVGVQTNNINVSLTIYPLLIIDSCSANCLRYYTSSVWYKMIRR